MLPLSFALAVAAVVVIGIAATECVCRLLHKHNSQQATIIEEHWY